MKRLPLTYSLELILDETEPSSSIGVRVIGLDGCFSQGDSIDEAIINAQEAIEGWIDITQKMGQKVPSPPKRPRVSLIRERSPWLTVGDISRNIGVSPATVRKIISMGSLTAFKFGNELRIREVDLALYLARSRVPLAA